MRYSIIVVLIVFISCAEPEVEPEYISPDPSGHYFQSDNNTDFPESFSFVKKKMPQEYFASRYFMYSDDSIEFFLLMDVKEAQIYRAINFYDSLNRILVFRFDTDPKRTSQLRFQNEEFKIIESVDYERINAPFK